MINSFLSVFSTQDLFHKVDELRKTWENFITNPSLNENVLASVRSEILHSWSRCQSIGLNPGQKQAKNVLTTLELEKLLSESDLYRAAKPIIDNIFDKLAGTGYLITLNDENGNMIYLKGESDIIRKTEKMNFLPGMDWSENAAGTNAIGTSIISKKPIQVFSAEHFCEGFHPMTCSSSPIFHPYTKKVIGAIDFTGLWPSTQPHTLGLAVSLAQIIEQELLTMYKEKYFHLEEYYHHSKTRWKDNPILVFSNEFVFINGDPVLMETLKLKKMMNIENHPQIKDLFQSMNTAANQTAYHTKLIKEAEKNGYQFKGAKPISLNREEIGYIIMFKEKNHQSSSLVRSLKERTIIGESAMIKNILHKCEQVAPINAPILLTGETGTGKELIARHIHERSSGNDKPFIAINCGAVQKELIGSELFGYEGGTFTGGKKDGKRGKFEEANGGTIFLDEIGEMPIDLQVHLLRVLQEKEFTRLGSSKPIEIDVKVIAATNKNLKAMIDEGLFRKDLFFRLNVISISIPSLRERKEDIIPISNYYLNQFAQKYKRRMPMGLTERTKDFFLSYTWPGNIRELRNALEHAVIFCDSSEVEKRHLPDYLAELKTKYFQKTQKPSGFSIIEKTEMEQIRQLLIQTGWNISAVSKELNVARSTLYRKLKKYNLKDRMVPYSAHL
ncbi:sigma-54-dependent Fis family transcriptional regulator [Neobacillus mesonae]|uniref:sigma-54-dependent Fis family transcriptional regulator n=1 Tax=Neobacillus mesonae TaxID=1193713 RepID=UPI00203A9338|nr:sigma-54-dependent Fis family transcriptional regulator [Neobacillus mesonae]MCM3568052.1 sigma-54-dependent Fis family transcriptional regulator [Neobacillus mesonae]